MLIKQEDVLTKYVRTYIYNTLQKQEKPKFVLCVTFSENGDTITGDSSGNMLVWGKGNGSFPTQTGLAMSRAIKCDFGKKCLLTRPTGSLLNSRLWRHMHTCVCVCGSDHCTRGTWDFRSSDLWSFRKAREARDVTMG